MAWNEPGGNGNQDPWGHKKNEQGPPDLDEVFQKIQNKMGNIFGNGNNNSDGSSDNNGGGSLSWSAIGFLAVIFLLIWSLFGFYIIQPAELGVVTQFGRYKETTEQGLNWHLPYPIETVEKVNVEQVRAINHRALMLTKDENIVVIELVVQYRIKNAENYLFKVDNPEDTLQQATESALREIVGSSKMDDVLTSERTRVALETKEVIQKIIDPYEVGLTVTSVNMQNAQPPAAVQAAFADVIKAREDQERSKNKANAYSNQIIERAKGTADRLIEEAEAYKAQVTAKSLGDTQRFLSVLKEYEKAPDITRQRLYIETMESVLSKTSKVMVDIKSGNNVMLLPLDKFLDRKPEIDTTPLSNITESNPSNVNQKTPTIIRNEDLRSRGGR
jgi:membrane protease subunit HflK